MDAFHRSAVLCLVSIVAGDDGTAWQLADVAGADGGQCRFVFRARCERHGYSLFSSYYVSWYLGALVAESEAAGLLAKRLALPRPRAASYGFGSLILCVGCAVFFLSSYIAFQIWAVAFAIFLFDVLSRPTAFRGWLARIFQWLGTFSFSRYIVHLPIIVLIHSIAFNSVHQVSVVPFCATLLVVVGCAYTFSFVFERPALALSQMLKGKPHLATRSGSTE
ncbi:MAG: acyltransferase [Alphaproteobacteria bacterium]|nr:acyltransferase [Alphaproteobacteria bacterium]MDE2495280.1 acyltransferase [Alphaproteobacteria bacterium]